MRRMPKPAVLATLALALSLAGCSQVAAIRPVSGTLLVQVRFATIDVLLDSGYTLRDVPACTERPYGGVVCTGTTVAGDAITSSSTGGAAPPLSVIVDGESIYDGPVIDVLDRAARAS